MLSATVFILFFLFVGCYFDLVGGSLIWSPETYAKIPKLLRSMPKLPGDVALWETRSTELKRLVAGVMYLICGIASHCILAISLLRH